MPIIWIGLEMWRLRLRPILRHRPSGLVCESRSGGLIRGIVIEIVALKWSVIQIAWFSCPRTHHFSYKNICMLGILELYSMPMGQET